MAIPGEMVKQIVSYLSPCDLARVAQLNKIWKQIVYSNSCWDLNKLWEVKPDSRIEFYSGLEIPSKARHLGGEPTPACFHDWLSLARKSMYHTTVPYCVLELDNFSDYVNYFKKTWISLGRPCIHTNHHKWYDVYRGREFLQKLNAADQQRIFYRHCRFVVERKVVDTNSYRFWIQNHIEFSLSPRYAFMNAPHETTPRSDHPADVITAAVQNKEHKCLLYLAKCREVVFQNIQTSVQTLRIYGKKEFNKKDLIWTELFPSSNKEVVVTEP
jgi:hypothetical protein